MVSIHKLGLTPEIQKLNLSLSNTNKESDGTPYIGNINHANALSLAEKAGGFVLSTLEATDLLHRLMHGIDKNEKVYYANGTEVPVKVLEYMFNEMTEIRNPWRSEWLHASFGNKTITYPKFDSSGNRVIVTEPLDKDTLMKDKIPGISLADYLKNPTSQGLPRKNAGDGSLYYWHPVDERVAGLFAGCAWVGLVCSWDPDGVTSLGVRRSKKISP